MNTRDAMPVNAYARALNGPQVAFDATLAMLEAMERDPQYASLVRQTGPVAADSALHRYGKAALASDFAQHLPEGLTLDDSTIARGRAAVRAAVLAVSTAQGPQADLIAGRIYDGLTRRDQVTAGQQTPDAAQVSQLVAQELRQSPWRDTLRSPDALTGPGAKPPDGSFFDSRGLTPLDKLGAGLVTSSRGYDTLKGGTWAPEQGLAGLTPENFASSPFARAGLDLPTTQYLATQQFTPQQIIHAGQDIRALGLNPKDRQIARDFAVLDRFDPDGRKKRNDAYKAYDRWQIEHQAEIDKLNKAVDGAPDDAARKAAIAARDAFLKAGQDKTGVSSVGKRLQDRPGAPGAKPGDKPDAINGHRRIIQEVDRKHGVKRHEIGIEPARKQKDAEVLDRSRPVEARRKGADVRAANQSPEDVATDGFNFKPGGSPAAPIKTAASDPPKPDEPAKPVQVAQAPKVGNDKDAEKAKPKTAQSAAIKPPTLSA